MAKTERKFRYQERAPEDIKERANMRNSNFDDFIKPKFKKFKPKDGKNNIRILPPTWEGAKHYGFDIFVNYNIGPDKKAYLSLSKMKGDNNDPIAVAKREAEKEGDDKLARELWPNRRILMWVIDRSAEEEGPQLWPAPFTFDKDLANLCTDEDTGEIIFLDQVKKGRDVRFYKEGKGMLTKYPASKMKVLNPSPIHDDPDTMDQWLEFIAENPVPECLQFFDADYIEQVFNGKSTKPKVDDDDEDPPPRKAKAKPVDDDEDEPPAKPKRRVAADDDEDDDAPPPKAKTKAKVVEPEDDDDEDEKPVRRRVKAEEPYDDEDEKPARRRAAAADDDDDDGAPPPKSESIRDRIRRSRAAKTDEDDE